MTKTLKLVILAIFSLFTFSCEESQRFEITHKDRTPPPPPVFLRYQPTYGGARIFYQKPSDKNLLSIDVEYTTPRSGDKRWFSVSHLAEHIDVFGFPTQEPQVVHLYAVSNAGVRSQPVVLTIEALEPAVEQVANTVRFVAGFGAFYVDWVNALTQSVNIFVDYEYVDANGIQQFKSIIYTSREARERQFVRNPDFTKEMPLSVKVRVEDEFGNISPELNLGTQQLMTDIKIPKTDWIVPPTYSTEIFCYKTGDFVDTGEPMAFLSGVEGRTLFVIDDIICDGIMANYGHSWDRGRSASPRVNLPWNFIIDLGDWYELSRIITHQRYSFNQGSDVSGRLNYYRDENVGTFSLWRWDEEYQEWDSITTHTIPVPIATEREFRLLGRQGDMAWMFPESPQFTKPTRWFRYEALANFAGNFSPGANANCLSEITLYGRKANVSY